MTIKFHYVKAPNYQEIPVDGAFGGISPNGSKLSFAVYSERFPIPRTVVHELQDSGKVGDEITEEKESRDGVIRNVHAVLHLDYGQTKVLRDWLNGKIDDWDVIRRQKDEKDDGK